jgi:hypothetical protein
MNIRSRIYYNIFTIVCQDRKYLFRKKSTVKRRRDHPKSRKPQKSWQKSKKAKKIEKNPQKFHPKSRFKYNEELSRKIAIKICGNRPSENEKTRLKNA